MPPHPEIPVEAVAAACRRGGLDLAHSLSLAWLDDELVDPWRPPSFPRDALAILIGNTRALWSAIREHHASAEPVDDWCERVITEAAGAIEPDVALRFAHRDDGEGYLPLQRIAHQAGFLHLAPSHLSIHPDCGPWVALRALVIVDHPGPEGPPPIAPDPCAACDRPCLAALHRARSHVGPIEEHWRDWVAVRDVCPVGRDARYDEAQIAYHYTKDRRWLEEGSD